MGFFSSIGHFLGKFAPYIADAALIATGNPEFIPVANAGIAGVNTAVHGGGIGKSLMSAGTSFLGSSIGSSIGNSLFPQTIGNAIGPSASNAIGGLEAGVRSGVGAGFGQTAANTVLNSSVGNAIGGFAGNQVANGFNAKTNPEPKPDQNSLLPAPFSPKNNPSLELPGSLSGLSSLTPDQQTSNIANQGVYGGGNGPQEKQYFTGLVNNQLVDPSGKVGDMGALSPIENSYLKQLGFGGYSNSRDLLGAINQWQAA